jgi:aromatic-amino-acid transaminase
LINWIVINKAFLLRSHSLPLFIFVKAVAPVLVSTSYSKNFAQYGERVGALSVVTGCAEEARLVEGQLKSIIRAIYSNPPAYGANLVSSVLNSQELYPVWVEGDIGPSRDRIKEMRQMFVEKLKEKAPEHDFDFIKDQQGMFSLLNLSVEQIRSMRFNDSVYLIESGRICIANLNTGNIDRVVNSIVKVLKQPDVEGGGHVKQSGKVLDLKRRMDDSHQKPNQEHNKKVRQF